LYAQAAAAPQVVQPPRSNLAVVALSSRRAQHRRQQQVGAYFGPTPTKYRSGEMDIDGPRKSVMHGCARLFMSQHHFDQATQGGTAMKSWTMNSPGGADEEGDVAPTRKIDVIAGRWHDLV
jgi:hypothetical protein